MKSEIKIAALGFMSQQGREDSMIKTILMMLRKKHFCFSSSEFFLSDQQ